MARTKTTSKSARRDRDDTSEGSVFKRARIDDTYEVIFSSKDSAYLRFIQEYENKKIVKGRVFDFKELGEAGLDLEVSQWLEFQGWKNFVSHEDSCYPRLVRALVCNLVRSTKKSWIGDVEVDLSTDNIRRCFNLSDADLTEIEWPTSRGRLFSDLAEVNISEKENYLHVSHLNLNLRLAYSVVINNVYPRLGAVHSVSEKDAKILWALKHKKKLNLAQIMLDQLYLVKTSRRFPLPYGMIFSKILREAGVDLRDEKEEPVKATDMIDRNSVKRLGFKLTADGWISDKPRKTDQIKQISHEEEEEAAAEEEVREERREEVEEEEPPVERIQEARVPEEESAAPIPEEIEAQVEEVREVEEEVCAERMETENESEEFAAQSVAAAAPSPLSQPSHHSHPSTFHHSHHSSPTPVKPFILSKQPSQTISSEPHPNSTEARLDKLEQ